MSALKRKHLYALAATLFLGAAPAAAGWSVLSTSGPVTARHECAFVELNDRFYLMGGRRINPVNVFDPAQLQWSANNNTPIELHHFQAVSHGGLIHAVGAMTGSWPGEPPIEHVLHYAPAQDRWVEGPVFPEARRRGGAGAVVRGNEIWLVGGQLVGHTSGTMGWVDRLNLLDGTWQAYPHDMPHPRDHVQIAQYGDLIYAAAGRVSAFPGNFDGTVRPVDRLDLLGSMWTTLADTLPTGRAGAPAGILGSTLYVAGGESEVQLASHSQCEPLDLGTDTFGPSDPLQIGRHGTQAIAYDGQLYVAAGSGNHGGNPELNSIEVFTPGVTPTLPVAVSHQDLAATADLDFGQVGVGGQKVLTANVSHPGAGGSPDLQLTGARIVGRDQNVFEALAPVGGWPQVLAPGASLDVQVRFLPDTLKVYGEGSLAYGGLSAAALAVEYEGGASAWLVPLVGEGTASATGVAAVGSLKAWVRNSPGPRPQIAMRLGTTSDVTVDVYSLQGRRLLRLVSGRMPAGEHAFIWDGRDAGGRQHAAGVYLLRPTVGGQEWPVQRVLLAR